MAAVLAQEVAVAEPSAPHVPVLVDRVVDLLAVPHGQDGLLVDATVGAGGHAAAMLDASGPGTRLLGLDRDPEALELAEQRLASYGARATLVLAGYETLDEQVSGAGTGLPVLAVVFDLGVSSMQLDRPGRGFSFRTDGPLDMRMDPGAGAPAAELVNTLDVDALAHLIREYGEERHARRIARAVVAARPITTTGRLAEVVAAAIPGGQRFRSAHRAPHPATRTFQALRIAVNDELERFSASLPQALELAAPRPATGTRGGRVAVLSYHSLEDRIAKRAFADAARGCVCPPDLPICACGRTPTVRLLTRGAERPGESEVAANPRARAAKLRAVEKLPAEPGHTGRALER